MGGPSSSVRRRLTKAHAVRLVNAIDTPHLRDEVLASLAWLLERPWPPDPADADSEAGELVRQAAEQAGLSASGMSALLDNDGEALTDLAISLSELRTLARPG